MHLIGEEVFRSFPTKHGSAIQSHRLTGFILDLSDGEAVMPLYTISTEEGVLSCEAKVALAAEIIDFHCKLSGVDRNFVKVVFASFPKGNGFVGGEASAPVTLTVLIRMGRSADYKRKMATELWSMIQQATGAGDAQMVVGIQELPASQAMEMGKIMPDVDS